jgi:hypothetical protein
MIFGHPQPASRCGQHHQLAESSVPKPTEFLAKRLRK